MTYRPCRSTAPLEQQSIDFERSIKTRPLDNAQSLTRIILSLTVTIDRALLTDLIPLGCSYKTGLNRFKFFERDTGIKLGNREPRTNHLRRSIQIGLAASIKNQKTHLNATTAESSNGATSRKGFHSVYSKLSAFSEHALCLTSDQCDNSRKHQQRWFRIDFESCMLGSENLRYPLPAKAHANQVHLFSAR